MERKQKTIKQEIIRLTISDLYMLINDDKSLTIENFYNKLKNDDTFSICKGLGLYYNSSTLFFVFNNPIKVYEDIKTYLIGIHITILEEKDNEKCVFIDRFCAKPGNGRKIFHYLRDEVYFHINKFELYAITTAFKFWKKMGFQFDIFVDDEGFGVYYRDRLANFNTFYLFKDNENKSALYKLNDIYNYLIRNTKNEKEIENIKTKIINEIEEEMSINSLIKYNVVSIKDLFQNDTYCIIYGSNFENIINTMMVVFSISSNTYLSTTHWDDDYTLPDNMYRITSFYTHLNIEFDMDKSELINYMNIFSDYFMYKTYWEIDCTYEQKEIWKNLGIKLLNDIPKSTIIK